MAKVGLYAIGTATILESNKSLLQIPGNYPRNTRSRSGFLAPVGGIFLSSRTAAGRAGRVPARPGCQEGRCSCPTKVHIPSDLVVD
jgi:hypothetical protein